MHDSKKNFAVLDLFSGIGGFSLGLEAAGAFRTVAFCEQDKFCQTVLRKHWPQVPIHDDVRTIDADGYRGIDILCGGFPCQPWSAAGEQRGAEDDRDLWPVMASLIKDIRPRWAIGENVRGFINEPLGLQRSLSDLESIGYQAVPFVIPACAKDARHRRDRVWIVAHTSSGKRQSRAEKQGALREVPENRREHDYSGGSGEAYTADVTNTDSQRLQGQRQKPSRTSEEQRDTRNPCWWSTEPNFPRVANGIPNRVDRIKSLGNSIVPQVAAEIFIAIKAMADGQEK